MRPVHAPGPLNYRFLVPIAVIVAKDTQKLSTGEVCLRGRVSVKEVFRLWMPNDTGLQAFQDSHPGSWKSRDCVRWKT